MNELNLEWKAALGVFYDQTYARAGMDVADVIYTRGRDSESPTVPAARALRWAPARFRR